MHLSFANDSTAACEELYIAISRIEDSENGLGLLVEDHTFGSYIMGVESVMQSLIPDTDYTGSVE